MPHDALARGKQLALAGVVVNLLLAGGKLLAGLLGNSYALIADAIESIADIAGSVIIWGGLHISTRPASQEHPYGYGRAESLAALAVSVMIAGAGIAIAVEAVREIITPHHTPAWWTLLVLVGVVGAKEGMYRLTARAADASDSQAVRTDAWHHRADALTSAAAFVGISLALIGKWKTGTDRYAPADDWAALLASGVILFNASRLIVRPVRELLDVRWGEAEDVARRAASATPGVRVVQKVTARRSGAGYWIDMHVWVDGEMSVRDAHAVAHAVKDAVRAALPEARDVLIHVEPAAER